MPDDGAFHGTFCGCGQCGGMQAAAYGLPPPQALRGSDASGDPEVDALVAGTRSLWNAGTFIGLPATVTFSFMSAAPSYSPVTSFRSFTETMQAGARLALAEFSEVAGLTLVEVADAGDGGQIRFGTNFQASSSGYADYPGTSPKAGDVWLNNARSYVLDLTPGSSGFQVMLHEIGHAVGLKHPGNYDAIHGSGTPPFLPAHLDNTFFTVMSYRSGVSGAVSELGPLDVEALQYAYGAAGGSGGAHVFFGTAAADLYAGTASRNYAEGRDGDDALAMGGGNDKALGQAGADTLSGGVGDDVLYGNIGLDLLSGGTGNDTLFGGQNGGALSDAGTGMFAYRDGTETLYGGEGNDVVYGNIGADVLHGDDGADILYGGQEGDLLLGGAGGDVLLGNLGADTLSGGDGADTLYGGVGDDLLAGGTGADVFRFWEPAFGADVIADFDPAAVDRLSIAYGGQTVFSQGPSGMVITTGAGQITLMGVDSSTVSSSWFV